VRIEVCSITSSFRSAVKFVSAIALAASLSACAGGASSGGMQAAGQLPAASMGSAVHASASRGLEASPNGAGSQRVYVSVQNLDAVQIFDLKSGQYVGSITNGLSLPYGVALDKSGNLYVANAGDGSTVSSVTAYAAGNPNPIATYPQATTQSARGVAVAKNGRLYVLDQDRSGAECQLVVNVYEKGSTNLSGTLDLPSYANCFTPAETLDSRGNLYVAYEQSSGSSGTAGITEFMHGSSKKVQSLTLPSYQYANDGLLVDKDDNVLLNGCPLLPSGGCAGDGGVNVWLFPAGQTAPTQELTPDYFGEASGLAFNPSRSLLFVSNIFGGYVYEFSYPQDVLVKTFVQPGSPMEMRGVAVGKGP
jgi:sugar lactone lactonase YvrE